MKTGVDKLCRKSEGTEIARDPLSFSTCLGSVRWELILNHLTDSLGTGTV